MEQTLNLILEVSGCPTVCMHCWAQGHRYAQMPVADVEFVLTTASQFCRERGLTLGSYPMHEILYHSKPLAVMKLFQEFCGTEYVPLPTVGVPLAIRDDWQVIFDGLRPLGVKTLWFTFHGVGEIHDGHVKRRGAYEETLLALKRTQAAGFECGVNVFLTKDNVGQFDELLNALRDVDDDKLDFEPARFQPTARARQYESVRPDLDDLLPIAEKVCALSPFHRPKWSNLEACTEAYYVREALRESDSEIPKTDWQVLKPAGPVCRSNLDVHTGIAGCYGERHGNLKNDDPDSVLRKSLEAPPCFEDSVYLRGAASPPLRELAEKCGNPNGTRIHFDASGMRLRWLDLASGKSRHTI